MDLKRVAELKGIAYPAYRRIKSYFKPLQILSFTFSPKIFYMRKNFDSDQAAPRLHKMLGFENGDRLIADIYTFEQCSHRQKSTLRIKGPPCHKFTSLITNDTFHIEGATISHTQFFRRDYKGSNYWDREDSADGRSGIPLKYIVKIRKETEHEREHDDKVVIEPYFHYSYMRFYYFRTNGSKELPPKIPIPTFLQRYATLKDANGIKTEMQRIINFIKNKSNYMCVILMNEIIIIEYEDNVQRDVCIISPYLGIYKNAEMWGGIKGNNMKSDVALSVRIYP
jgi:hypothetical protein